MMRSGRNAITFGATLLFAACAVLERPHEVTTFAPALLPLDAPADLAAAAPSATSWRLALDEPQAIAPFDGVRLAVAPVAGELEFYKDARWRERAPLMLQDLLLQAFDAAAPQAHAARATVAGTVEYRLRADLRALTAEYRGAAVPTVVVHLAVQLLRRSDGRVIAARSFEAERQAQGTQVPQVAAAFEQVLNRVSRDVVGWSVAQAGNDTQATSNDR